MGTSLLELDVNKLFEQNTIDGVQIVHKKLKAEVDRKREELRVTVGERYRDLIEAADTIRDMKSSTRNVLSHLSGISSLLNSLKHRQLIGFTTNAYKTKLPGYPLYAIATQIKLLLDVPELIWTSVEESSFLKAAQLYQLAFHLHSSLTMDPSSLQAISCIPIISKQWGTIKYFREVILNEVSSSLQKPVISAQVAAEGMTAIALLKPHSMSALLQLFLSEREQAFERIFAREPASNLLITALECVETSWVLIHALFAEGFMNSNLTQGLISTTLKAVCSSATPFVSTLEDFLPLKNVTSNVSEFRPTLSRPLDPLPMSELRAKCVSWSQNMRKIWLAHATPLVARITCVSQVVDLREQLFQRLSQSNCTSVEWDEICTRLTGHNHSLWQDNLQPLVQKRTQALLDEKVVCFLTQFQEGVLQAVEDDRKKGTSEVDVRNWLWVETGSDLPLSVLKVPIQNGGLFLKCRGLTPTVVQLCTQLEQKFQVLLEDLNSYKPESGMGQEDEVFLNRPVFDRFADWPAIFNHLQTTVVTEMEKMLPKLLERIINSEITHTLLLGRLGLGLIELTPQMKQIAKAENSESWVRLVGIFRKFACEAFEAYLNCQIAQSSHLLSEQLTWQSSFDTLRLLPAWEDVVVQEHNQSMIRVPVHLNYALENALAYLTKKVIIIGPHTLPKKVLRNMMENVAQMSLACFTVLLNNSAQLPQTIALQFLFDIKFLTAYFIPGHNKVLQEKIKRLCESLEGRVDPFDLTLISPHIQSNVKRSLQKCQFLFGPMITPDRHAMIHTSKIDLVHTEPAMLLSFGTPIPPKFLALPLAMPSKTTRPFSDLSVCKLGVESHKKIHAKKVRKRDASPSSARSSAAAFFGAMSSSLFGQH